MKGRPRIIAIAGFSCALICIAALHLLRTDLSPVSHRLSEYAVGPYGWVMTAAFVSLSCGLVAMGIVFRAEASSRIAWALPSAAFVAACGAIVSALFKTGTSDLSEAIHSRASAIAVVAVVALALARSMPGVPAGPGETRDRIGVGLAVAAATLAAISPLLHETRFTGLSQRVMWIVLISWLLWTSWRPSLTGGSGRPIPSHRRDHAQ